MIIFFFSREEIITLSNFFIRLVRKRRFYAKFCCLLLGFSLLSLRSDYSFAMNEKNDQEKQNDFDDPGEEEHVDDENKDLNIEKNIIENSQKIEQSEVIVKEINNSQIMDKYKKEKELDKPNISSNYYKGFLPLEDFEFQQEKNLFDSLDDIALNLRWTEYDRAIFNNNVSLALKKFVLGKLNQLQDELNSLVFDTQSQKYKHVKYNVKILSTIYLNLLRILRNKSAMVKIYVRAFKRRLLKEVNFDYDVYKESQYDEVQDFYNDMLQWNEMQGDAYKQLLEDAQNNENLSNLVKAKATGLINEIFIQLRELIFKLTGDVDLAKRKAKTSRENFVKSFLNHPKKLLKTGGDVDYSAFDIVELIASATETDEKGFLKFDENIVESYFIEPHKKLVDEINMLFQNIAALFFELDIKPTGKEMEKAFYEGENSLYKAFHRYDRTYPSLQYFDGEFDFSIFNYGQSKEVQEKFFANIDDYIKKIDSFLTIFTKDQDIDFINGIVNDKYDLELITPRKRVFACNIYEVIIRLFFLKKNFAYLKLLCIYKQFMNRLTYYTADNLLKKDDVVENKIELKKEEIKKIVLKKDEVAKNEIKQDEDQKEGENDKKFKKKSMSRRYKNRKKLENTNLEIKDEDQENKDLKEKDQEQEKEDLKKKNEEQVTYTFKGEFFGDLIEKIKILGLSEDEIGQENVVSEIYTNLTPEKLKVLTSNVSSVLDNIYNALGAKLQQDKLILLGNLTTEDVFVSYLEEINENENIENIKDKIEFSENDVPLDTLNKFKAAIEEYDKRLNDFARDLAKYCEKMHSIEELLGGSFAQDLTTYIDRLEKARALKFANNNRLFNQLDRKKLDIEKINADLENQHAQNYNYLEKKYKIDKSEVENDQYAEKPFIDEDQISQLQRKRVRQCKEEFAGLTKLLQLRQQELKILQNKYDVLGKELSVCREACKENPDNEQFANDLDKVENQYEYMGSKISFVIDQIKVIKELQDAKYQERIELVCSRMDLNEANYNVVDQQINEIKNEINEIQSKINEAKKSNEEEENKTKKSNEEEDNERIIELENSLQDLQNQLELCYQEYNGYLPEYDNFMKNLEFVKSEFDAFKRDELTRQFQENFNQMTKEKEEELANLQNKHNEEIKELQISSAEQVKKANQEKNLFKNIQIRYEQLSEQKESIKNDIEYLEEKLKALHERREELVNEKNSQESNLAEGKVEEQEIQNVENYVEQLANDIVEIEGEIEKLNNQLADMKAQEELYNKQFEACAKQMKSVQEDIEILNKDNEELKLRIDEKEKNVQALQADLKTREEINAKDLQAAKELKQKYDKLTEDYNNLREQKHKNKEEADKLIIEQKEAFNNELKAKEEYYAQNFELLKQNYKELEAKYNELQLLQDKNKKAAELKKKINNKRKSVDLKNQKLNLRYNQKNMGNYYINRNKLKPAYLENRLNINNGMNIKPTLGSSKLQVLGKTGNNNIFSGKRIGFMPKLFGKSNQDNFGFRKSIFGKKPKESLFKDYEY